MKKPTKSTAAELRLNEALQADLKATLRDGASETPRRVFFSRFAQAHFDETRAALARAEKKSGVTVRAGYSIKTNPLPHLVALAREHGMWAEAISQLEAAHALKMGFPSHQVVLNGPAKWWPAPLDVPRFGVIFCDSIEELRLTRSRDFQKNIRTDFLGVRLRPATVNSRFGISIHLPEVFTEVVQTLSALPKGQGVGFHMHLASSMMGVRTWAYLAHNFMAAVTAIMEHVGKRPLTLSFGGGWHPDEWYHFLNDILPGLLSRWGRGLKTLERAFVEPGKALAQPSMGVVMRALEVRRLGDHRDIVVDGSVAEVPDINTHPHRIVSLSNTGKTVMWPRGPDRLLGRLCMEFDFVSEATSAPKGLKAGERFVVLDSGAYDTSMGYVFGRGA